MQKARVLIVEDEYFAAESLKRMLSNIGFDVSGIYRNGNEFLKSFTPESAEVIIMDIYLSDNTSGVDTAIALKKIADTPVIFITKNEDEYLEKKAINETNAVHYLSKPFNKREVRIALEFALRVTRQNEFNDLRVEDIHGIPSIESEIFLKNDLGYRKVNIADIVMLEADRSYCKFTFNNHKQQLFSENLSYYEQKLKFSKDLLRVHRSYLVNLNYIERLHENRLWIKGVEVPIGRSYKNALVEKFRFV